MQPDFLLVPVANEDPKQAAIHDFFSLNQLVDLSSLSSPLMSSSFPCSHEDEAAEFIMLLPIKVEFYAQFEFEYQEFV